MTAWIRAREAAHQAREQGFLPFPLSSGKVPAIPSPHRNDQPGAAKCRGECGRFGHGVYDATTDAGKLNALFGAAPRATGYGIACGAGPVPLIGLDLDRKHGVDGVAHLNRICAELNVVIPRTVTVCTPSGGFHLWFTGPRGVTVRNSAGKIAPGIDVRGTAGYLVGPGSWGASGQYFVHPSLTDATVYPIPEPLLALLLPPPPVPQPRRAVPYDRAGQDGGRALVGLVRTVLNAGQGQRNDRLYWAACKAYEHAAAGRLDYVGAERALIRAAVEAGLSESEATRTVASARGMTAGAAR